MNARHRSAKEWFEEAARCYVANHQGCAWCGGSHRVFHRNKDNQQSYYCHGCDFKVGLDESTGKFFTIPGEDVEPGKLTMYEARINSA